MKAKQATTFILIMLAGLLSLTACATAAEPASTGAATPPILVQAIEPTSEPTEEPTEQPTAEPDGQPGEPAGGEDPTPEPTPEPTKEPWPEEDRRETVRSRPRPPDPGLAPFPDHPDGLDGCRKLTIFDRNDYIAYNAGCSEQLNARVYDDCGSLPTRTEQWDCGKGISAEYDHFGFRYGYGQCSGVDGSSDESEACSHQAVQNINKGFQNLHETWAKVRVGGDRDTEVVKAWAATVACLERAGFRDVDRDLLFPWQAFDPPDDHLAKEAALTGPDKDLREHIREPSRDCAKQEGLFAAQDSAWATELRRLSKDEPDLVALIIREGLLEELEKPGASPYLSADPAASGG